jgi:hypothetical protein
MTRLLLALLLVGCVDPPTPESDANVCRLARCPKRMVPVFQYSAEPRCLCVPGALPKEK